MSGPEGPTVTAASSSGSTEGSQALYSLHGALLDLLIVFAISSILYIGLVYTGLAAQIVGWIPSRFQTGSEGLVLYAVLVTAGFAVANLRRWTQLTEILKEQTEIQTELEHNTEQLGRRNEELEQFSYAAAHDLREPLRMVNTYLGLLERRLEEDALDEEEHRFFQEARNASVRMDNMVQALLQFATVDPQAEISQPTDAEEALDIALDGLFADNPEADIVEIQRGSLPDVLCQPHDLATVFRHLLDNALRHGGGDLSRIEIDGERKGDKVHLFVLDDGDGIDDEQEEQIFRAFQRRGGTCSSAGVGMGLPLCRRLLERHRGKVELERSAEGAGFRIVLPRPTRATEGALQRDSVSA